MKGKDLAIVGGIIFAGGLVSVLLAVSKIRSIIDKGEIVLDASNKMPEWISTFVKQNKVLPKRIPIKKLIEAIKNKKRQSEIDELLKWLSLRIEIK